MKEWSKAEREECVRLSREQFLTAKDISTLTEIPVVQIQFWLTAANWAPRRRATALPGTYRAARHQDWEAYYAGVLRSRFLKLAKKFPSAANPPTRPELLVWLRGLGSPACGYCSVPLTPKNFAVDHRWPVSRGGTSAIFNLLPACRRCNETKGGMSEQEFRQLRALVTQWEDRGRGLLARLRSTAVWARGGPDRSPAVPPPTV